MDTSKVRELAATVRSFLSGETDIFTFRSLYDTNPEINDFLQAVIDYYIVNNKPFPGCPHQIYTGLAENVYYFKNPTSYPGFKYGNAPFGSVRDYLTQEFNMCTTDVRSAHGALEFYDRVYVLFCQYEQTEYRGQKYIDAYKFSQDAIPEYLSGGESETYISKNIIPLFPETMPKTKRIKAIRAKIREEFRSDKGYPAWIQYSEWPLGADGKPAVYTGSKKKDGGESKEYYFRDETNGEIITVKQFY